MPRKPKAVEAEVAEEVVEAPKGKKQSEAEIEAYKRAVAADPKHLS